MPNLIDSEPGVILHTRPYKEHSLLVELYTLNYGRVSAVARVSKKSSSHSIGIYQPFILLKLSLRQGSSALWNLTDAYMQRVAFKIEPPRSFSATYLNELLYYLIKTHDSEPRLFAAYIKTLESLEKGMQEVVCLRDFESTFIETLGYAIDYSVSDVGDIKSDEHYYFSVNNGFIKALKEESNTFSGQDLLNIHQHNLKDKNTQLALKKINKSVIDELLQGRELKSRLLYQQFMAVK